MAVNGQEKISIFVDVQNVYYTCRQEYKANFDYNTFWRAATANKTVVSAFAYATDRNDQKQKQFQTILRAIGFTVKLKPMLKRADGSAKADWDVGISLDAYEQAEQCDRIILVSGDGDFDILLHRIKQRFNTQSDVYGVPQLTSEQLKKASSQFIPIDQTLLLKP